MSGRAFVWRWSWRLVRNEWRQYTVILVVLSVGVAAAVTGVLVGHNMTSPPETEYGNGQVEANSWNPEALRRALDDSGLDYGVMNQTTVQRDGRTGEVSLLVADPGDTITAPLFALVEGRWPTNEGQIAVTDRALADRPSTGTSVVLDGHTVEIVGVVENPTRLSQEFVFAAAPTVFESANTADATRFFVDASADELSKAVNGDFGIAESDGPSNRAATTILVNVIVAFGMLEVALLVGSTFSVIARRRTRQYGLLAACGASPKMVRSAAASSGVIIGLIGTTVGLALGLVIARLLVGAIETSVDHRIAFEYPFFALLPSIVMGVAVTALAARQPASALGRRSVASLLSAARPKAESVGWPATAGVVLALAGVASLIIGFQRQEIYLAVLGTIVSPVGLLLLAPLLVRVLGKLATRLPLAERLAGRSIARYNRRSASMVAALALALSIPVGIAVVTTSVDQRAENRPPNLADNQLIVWAPDIDLERSVVPASTDEEALNAAVAIVSDVASELSFTPLQVTVMRPEEGFTENGITYDHPIAAGKKVDGQLCNFCSVDTIGFGDGEEYIATAAFVATPALLDALDLETDWLSDGKVALAGEPGLSLVEPGLLAGGDAIAVSATWPNIGSFPKVLYSPDVADGMAPRTVGWLAINDGPLDDETLAAIGEANLPGVILELPRAPASSSSLRTLGLAIGVLAGLGITVAAVVLLTGELARETALLASLGASPRTGRRMSAALAGLLAMTGALLAVLIGYVPLAPMRTSRVDNFPFVVPGSSLFVVLVALPVIAATIGWLLSKKSAGGLDLRDFV